MNVNGLAHHHGRGFGLVVLMQGYQRRVKANLVRVLVNSRWLVHLISEILINAKRKADADANLVQVLVDSRCVVHLLVS